jgi:hypothetical protein
MLVIMVMLYWLQQEIMIEELIILNFIGIRTN